MSFKEPILDSDTQAMGENKHIRFRLSTEQHVSIVHLTIYQV
jgi:hypothetical protein